MVSYECRVISRLSIAITHIKGLLAPHINTHTHEPPSMPPSMGCSEGFWNAFFFRFSKALCSYWYVGFRLAGS